jgi:hypothetical protein
MLNTKQNICPSEEDVSKCESINKILIEYGSLPQKRHAELNLDFLNLYKSLQKYL